MFYVIKNFDTVGNLRGYYYSPDGSCQATLDTATQYSSKQDAIDAINNEAKALYSQDGFFTIEEYMV
jgi:hypothetical protein